MKPPLFTPGPATDQMFIQYRDDRLLASHRSIIESQWERYQRYCGDRHFATEIRNQFHQRAWELSLACTLLDSGLRLKRANANGPDLCIDHDPPVWIEAVSAKPGIGPDRVESDYERRDQSIPLEDGCMVVDPPSEESIILRCNHALDAKATQIAGWMNNGVLARSHPCMVAISLGDIEGADFFECAAMPIYLKAFFGIGDLCYDPAAASVKSGYRPRSSVTKASGSKVSTRVFLEGRVREVSAAIFSFRNTFRRISENQSDLVLIHNPTALNRLEPGIVRLAEEWLLEDQQLKCIKHA